MCPFTPRDAERHVLAESRLYVDLAIILFALLTIFGVTFWILSVPPFQPMFLNSDILLPFDLARDHWRLGLPLSKFQLPRVPSLIPDMALTIPLALAGLSWRQVVIVVCAAQFGILTLAAGMVLRPLTGGRPALLFLLLALALLLWEVGHGRVESHVRLILQILSHGGPFLMTLFGAALALRWLAAPRPLHLLALLLLGAACFLSDRLTLLQLQAPCAFALLPSLVRRPGAAAWLLLATMVAGAALGFALDHWLFAGPLSRQGDAAIDFSLMARRAAALLRHTPLADWLIWPLPVLLLFALMALIAGDEPRGFLLRFAAAACLLPTLAAALLIYEDRSWFRYLHALYWWPVILAALLLYRLPKPVRWAAPSLALLCSLPAALLVPVDPVLADWRHKLHGCLAAHADDLRDATGLAGYWNARALAVSLDWRFPIEQINPDGTLLDWGNDPARVPLSLAAHPRRFVVMDGLDADAITRSYGRPDRVIACSGSAIWLYDDARRVDPALGARCSGPQSSGPRPDFVANFGPNCVRL